MNSEQIYHVDFKQSKRIKSFQYAGGIFQLTSDGVIFVGKDKDNNELPPRWICSSLSIVAKTRDANSGEWGRLLEWVDLSINGLCLWLYCKEIPAMLDESWLDWD